MRKLILSALCGALSLCAFSQKKAESYKFEKITPEMLSRKVYDVDSQAHAVILADVGGTVIEGNNKGWFSSLFRRHKRIHILNKSAYDAATFEIPLYHEGREVVERLEGVKAVAYNLENGQVVETKLSKDNIFTEVRSKNLDIKKFTLPAVKEGTIIDVEYRVFSDYIHVLNPWDFQGTLPRLWSEYTLSVPQFFDYAFTYKGYLPFYLTDKKDHVDNFNVTVDNGTQSSDRYSFTSGVTDYRWVTKDVPGFQTESFISSVSNYMSHMDFQLAAYKEPLRYKNLVPTWPEKTKEMLSSPDFGEKLDRNNGWLSETMQPLLTGTATEKAQKIYGWVRDHITCNGNGGIYLSQPVKSVLKTGSGTVSEVNLLLVTMLRYADLPAEPVMLSTRDNGYVYTTYPLLSRFNYVIAGVNIGGQMLYLDATKPRLGFGRLLPDCYNGMARTINADATPVVLHTDSLRERKITSVFITSDNKKGWVGSFQQVPGYYESYNIRRQLQEKGKDQYFADIRKSLGESYEISKPGIDSLGQFEHPVGVHYDLKLDLDNAGTIYFNPMFTEGWKSNPLKSNERTYPVEMPYTFDEVYNLTLYIPDGYMVDELPKQMRVRLNEQGDGQFDYLISVSNDVVSLRSQVRLSRANFLPEEYETLRAFFEMIVSKQKEQIVFKKKP